MNDLEDRLRVALRERAEDFTASPGAWERTVDRAWGPRAAEPRGRPVQGRLAGGRPVRGSLGRLAPASFAPLAAAAAVVTIAVALGAVTHLTGRNRGPASGLSAHAGGSGSAAGVTTPRPLGLGSSFLQWMPPSTAVILVTQPYGGQTISTDFWFVRGTNADQMCAYTVSSRLASQRADTGATKAVPGIRCGYVALNRGHFASWLGGNELAMSVCQGVGIAAWQVVSVTAVLPGGRQVPGVVTSGRGFRYKAWTVAYPQKDAGHTTLVFRDAAGHELDHLTGN
ncbi:MAG: hypothetical protein JOY82_13580 [Streptosporangiaceae bacterium]|nr:hypothetical protein [Streptosporangiaceae bacterium]